MTFKDLQLHPSIQEGLDAMNFEKPTPIQEQAIPIIIEGHDLIGCAQTGTGKTAAYLLPVLHELANNHQSNVHTIIIAPTRELALQIDQQIEGFAYFVPVTSAPVYGGGSGEDFLVQKKALTKGAEIIVATPGKLLSHLNLGYVNLKEMKHLILDEADRMLDMGFHDDIMKIVSYMPKKRQTLLFSATMPSKIRDLAKALLTNPKQIDIALSKPAEGILQAAYCVYDNQKVALLKSLLTGKELPSVIVFVSTKSNVKLLTRELKRSKFNVAEMHSDLEQKERENVLRSFKNKTLQILVATDIVARGIDVEDISLVVNYDVPNDAEDYVHRIGRTARAASTGVAITFINTEEQYEFSKIEQLIEKEVPKAPLPTELGKGPEYAPDKHKSSRSFGRGRNSSGGNRGKNGGFKGKKHNKR